MTGNDLFGKYMAPWTEEKIRDLHVQEYALNQEATSNKGHRY